MRAHRARTTLRRLPGTDSPRSRALGIRAFGSRALGAGAAAALVLAGCSSGHSGSAAGSTLPTLPPSNVAVPSVIGPIAGPGSPSILSTGFDLSSHGYQTQEYFFSGSARSYSLVGSVPANGAWTVQPGSTADYETRMLVYRPVDASKFNGTVVVEWLNVSAGSDTAPDWIGDHTELMREGFAWVGVSAQRQGVSGGNSVLGMQGSGLVGANPARYGSLHHPGDNYSFDIFSQAGQALRHPGATRPLGNLVPKALIADGESQSAFYMTTYYDAIQPRDHVFDGFLVHSRGSGGATLDAQPFTAGFSMKEPFRTDQQVPVLTVTTESDLTTLGYAADTQPDSAHFRDWEIAGTSHADIYTVTVGPNDDGSSNTQTAMVAAASQPLTALGCTEPVNSGPQHWVLDAAVNAVNRWVRDGRVPPVAPRLQMTTSQPSSIARDARGNALGGIRTPAVDAPISTLSGVPPAGASLLCGLFGSTVAYDSATLAQLYPSHGAYVDAVRASADAAAKAGFLLGPDAAEIVAAASSSQVS